MVLIGRGSAEGRKGKWRRTLGFDGCGRGGREIDVGGVAFVAEGGAELGGLFGEGVEDAAGIGAGRGGGQAASLVVARGIGAELVQQKRADAHGDQAVPAHDEIGEDGLPDLGSVETRLGDRVEDEASETVEDRAAAVDFQAVQLGHAVGDEDRAAGVEAGAGEGFFPIGGETAVFLPIVVVLIDDDVRGVFAGEADGGEDAGDVLGDEAFFGVEADLVDAGAHGQGAAVADFAGGETDKGDATGRSRQEGRGGGFAEVPAGAGVDEPALIEGRKGGEDAGSTEVPRVIVAGGEKIEAEIFQVIDGPGAGGVEELGIAGVGAAEVALDRGLEIGEDDVRVAGAEEFADRGQSCRDFAGKVVLNEGLTGEKEAQLGRGRGGGGRRAGLGGGDGGQHGDEGGGQQPTAKCGHGRGRKHGSGARQRAAGPEGKSRAINYC